MNKEFEPMKILRVLACTLLLGSSVRNAAAQTTATTKPVGYRAESSYPVGEATVVFGDGVLTIGNIGTSGQDGVEVDVRLPGLQTLATFMDWRWWDPDNSLPLGASFQSEILGTIGGIPDQRIGTWRMEKTAFATYESTLDWASLGLSGMRIVLAKQDGTVIGEIPDVPDGASVVMQVDVGVLDPAEPFQQAWIVGAGTSLVGPGATPLPPGMESLCGVAFQCEYHGWPALSELGLRSDGELVQAISTDPLETTGILVVLGNGGVPTSVEEITRLRLTFANIPEFQLLGDLLVLVVPEPSSVALALLAMAGFGATAVRKRKWGKTNLPFRKI
jgi:hypothetical protein